MTSQNIGYARCSTDKQDLTAQIEALQKLGVYAENIFTDFGFSGRNKVRPGLNAAMSAVREGDTFIVTKMDRLARSVIDARSIGDNLAARKIKLQIGSAVYAPDDPLGKLFFNMLATFAEFESDLIRQRTKEGVAVAKERGRFKGKQPKLSKIQERELIKMHQDPENSIADLAAIFNVHRATIHRTIKRAATNKEE